MADTENNSETEVKKVVKEVPVVQDHGLFVHDTGDYYDGLFEAKKKDHSVKMSGAGVYTTAEGDVYSGVWEADRLGISDVALIRYRDGSKYEGNLKDWCYGGHAKYVYPDESTLLCDFVENAPAGKMRLLDPNGHAWLGKAELGFSWMEPSNHYYDMLEKARESKIKKRVNKSKEFEENVVI